MAEQPKRLDAENFVRIWQVSASPEDFTQRSGGLDFKKAAIRASYLRKKGVPLKKFPRQRLSTLDIVRLRELAQKFDPALQEEPGKRKARGA